MKQNLDSLLPASEEGLYPIRTVSEVTGVNAITLRAWERRYGLFKPQRTPKGHRLYSQKDILRIQQVLQLLEKGVAIGRIAKVLKNETKLEDLADLTMRSNSGKHPLESENKEAPTEDQWKIYHEKLMSHVNTYDIAQLERLHHEAFSLYPVEIISRSLILPTINELRAQAEQLQSLSGNYHFYWHFLQQRLGGMFLRSSLQNHGKKILLMGYGDNKADIEIMLFGLPLLTHGYRVVLLGCDISFDAIPMTLSRAGNDALIIYTASNESIENKNTDSQLNLEIVMSIKTVADSLNMPVFVSGENNEQQASELVGQGLLVLPDNSLEQLQTMDQYLSKNDK